MIAPLLLACVDYGLEAQGGDTAAPGQGPSSTYGTAGVTVPAEGQTCVEGLADEPDPTCGPVDFRGFEMVLERRFDHAPPNGGAAYLSAPVAFPTAEGVVVAMGSKHSDDGDELRDLLLVDGASAALVGTRGLPSGEPQHVAASRPVRANGAPGGLELYASTWDRGNPVYRMDYDSGAATELGLVQDVAGGVFTAARDIDMDGIADVSSGGFVSTSDGAFQDAWCDSTVGSLGPVLFDGTGSGDLLLAYGGGLADIATGVTTPWEWPERSAPLMAFTAVGGADGAPFVVVVELNTALVVDARGTLDISAGGAWPYEHRSGTPPAVGDLDGDGLADVVFAAAGEVRAVHVEGPGRGQLFQRWRLFDSGEGNGNINLALADLDADGTYEVVAQSTFGFYLLDGASGEVLWSDLALTTLANLSSLLVADVDGDGSAEVVFRGDEVDPDVWIGDDPNVDGSTLFVFGAAEGEWARTRPIWNQVPYDITTVRDDGAIVRFPRPSWQQYNAYRAQPAHDGDRPDLAPRVTEVCADVCGPGGTVTLTVVVDNLGSAEAAAGASLVLSTWAAGEPWISEVARSTLPGVVSSGATTTEVTFTLPWEQWKDARVIDVWGTHEDECDYVNDRVDVAEDPCTGG